MWMVYVAVAIDLFSDGLVIGAGSAVATGLALVLALGQVLADVPEGFAAIANLKDKGVPRPRRLLLGASFAIPVLAAAGLSYVALRGQGDGLKMAALTFTAGLLMVAAIEDMIAEAHESGPDSRTSILAFVGGFVLFTLVSSGLGGDG
jgi:ZIP family zinc transporter